MVTAEHLASPISPTTLNWGRPRFMAVVPPPSRRASLTQACNSAGAGSVDELTSGSVRVVVHPRHAAEAITCTVTILDGMDDYLFQGGDLRLALEAQGQKMGHAVDAEPEESLKQADHQEWAEALAHHFAVAPPALRADDVWMEPVKEITIDVSGDRRRDFSDAYSELARAFPGYRIVVHVPFDGEADVFKLRPSQFTTNPPRGRVSGHDVLLTIEYPRDSQPGIDGAAQNFIDTVGRWLDFARTDIASFNAGLAERALQKISGRNQRLQQRDLHLAQSKIPVRRAGESGKKTYIPDVLVRRPAPSLPTTRADDKRPTLEPALDARVFEHILGVIRMHGRQMEQSPGTYVALGEEDRRQTLVATLNTHYEGRAHAEAFNVQGKTDILIRHEGRNLFICECKFWSGQEGFTATIDQLFSYTGWRDTKLAIVMFVRERGLAAILKKAAAALERHECFVGWRAASGETELRAEMHWPGDSERHAHLNVFLVHTPERNE